MTTQRQTIFIVDDEPWYGSMLQHFLQLNPDYKVERFERPEAMLSALSQPPIAITLDYSMPGMDGSTLMRRIHERHPGLPVIVISGQEDIHTAVDLLKQGAYDYIVKDGDTTERLAHSLRHIAEKHGLQQEIVRLKKQVDQQSHLKEKLLGESHGILKVQQLISKAATTTITVSILGETGTGKELVARAIHDQSKQADAPFVAINVAALPADLLESELFGHEKGAFTGAATRRTGKFEEANGGTLFLDEIGELQAVLQAKLLRVLQEKKVTRLGSNKEIPLDLRIVVATHQNLEAKVSDGSLREDLYYRLLGLRIELPPLRERGADILLLADQFMTRFAREQQLPKPTLTSAAQSKLLGHGWPGNVRELKAVMELAVVLSPNPAVEPEAIQLRQAADPKDHFFTEEKTMDAYQQDILQHYLNRYQNNITMVAAKLGIGKSTIYRMLKTTGKEDVS